MRVGVISDLHANRIALDAVLSDMPAIDLLVCAGDVVGYNPWPAECVDELRERGVPTVCGNHDAAVVEGRTTGFNRMARAGLEHARAQLSDDQLEWLSNLPAEHLTCDDRIRLVHGHPDDPDRYSRYTYPEEFSPRLLGDEQVLVLGHTHVQGVRQFAEGLVVNPGSVGQPRDGDPRAAYAVVDLETMSVEPFRVEYDVDAVQTAVRDAELPARIGRRLARGA